MTIVFQEVTSQIEGERGAGTPLPHEAQGVPLLPEQQLDEFKRALQIVDERRARLTAD